ncbi:MAG: helicase RepA family protein [Bacillota bacterium]|jgi:RecA-family ATPase|nr:helicase RepA family protein [Bacillota bacterium]
MTDKKEMTALNTSVGADDGQSLKSHINSIPENSEDFNDYKENILKMQQEFYRQMDPSYLKTVSMTELYDTVYPGKAPLIDGFLYPGTYLFVGAPKLGKSFLMAQLAYHISTGTELWNYSVRKGTVLYLALEDDYKRLQTRLYKMFGTEGTENLFFSVSAGQLGNGLDEQLQGFMQEHPDTTLIIIDTLQKVREVGGDSYSYSNDYEIINRLKKFADSYGICLLLVHHTRKQQSDDRFDMISGTNGLLGAADGAFLLQKEKRTSNSATLDVSGRDQQDQKLYLVRDPEKLIWTLERTETELWKESPEPLLEAIAKHITDDNPKWNGTPSELVTFLGVDMKANVLTLKLNVNAARLFNEYGIRYENRRCHDGRKVSLIKETELTS